MKVIETTATSEKTTTKIDLEIDHLPKIVREEIAAEVGGYILAATLEYVSQGKSPVSGESFKALSRDYKKKKVELGGKPIPDLELEGDLKDSYDFKIIDEGIEIGFWGDQAPKADGHLKFSGKENATPKRRMLPAEDQVFKRSIISEVNRIIEERESQVFDE
jgi:hypothetical protein